MKQSIVCILVALLLVSCKDSPVPKPRGYFRIDLPEKKYKQQLTDCSFNFEIPAYATYQKRNDKKDECWFNLNFPQFKAQVHFTYRPIKDDLRKLLDDSYSMAVEHQVKANDIQKILISNDSTCVYGLIFRLDGAVATPIQLYLTDSVNHFLRGSLYFNSRTNSDSLAPIIQFIEADIIHLANTLHWNKSACN